MTKSIPFFCQFNMSTGICPSALTNYEENFGVEATPPLQGEIDVWIV